VPLAVRGLALTGALVPAAVLPGAPAPAGVVASAGALVPADGPVLGPGAGRCPGGPPGALSRSATSVRPFTAPSLSS
jgi:hypothetical protein